MFGLRGCLGSLVTKSRSLAVLNSPSRRFYYYGSNGPWREDFEEEPGIYETFPQKRRRCHSKFRPARPSKESDLVIQLLRIAQEKSETDLDTVFRTKFSRLISDDMKYVFITFVKDQNFELAFKVFELIRQQGWYQPQFTAYEQLIQSYCQAEGGKKPMVKVYELLLEAEKAGLSVTRRMCQHPIKCCLGQNDFDTCLKIYEVMRKSGLVKHYQFYRNIVRALEGAGLDDQAQKILSDHSELARGEPFRRRSTFIERYQDK